MWGGVIVWNPEDPGDTPDSKQPVRHKISYQVRCLPMQIRT